MSSGHHPIFAPDHSVFEPDHSHFQPGFRESVYAGGNGRKLTPAPTPEPIPAPLTPAPTPALQVNEQWRFAQATMPPAQAAQMMNAAQPQLANQQMWALYQAQRVQGLNALAGTSPAKSRLESLGLNGVFTPGDLG